MRSRNLSANRPPASVENSVVRERATAIMGAVVSCGLHISAVRGVQQAAVCPLARACNLPHAPPSFNVPMEAFHGTTILSVRRGASVALGGDGQVTLGNVVVKGGARKIRRLHHRSEER